MERLSALIGIGKGRLHIIDHLVGRGEQLFRSSCGAGLEGVISKRGDSPC